MTWVRHFDEINEAAHKAQLEKLEATLLKLQHENAELKAENKELEDELASFGKRR